MGENTTSAYPLPRCEVCGTPDAGCGRVYGDDLNTHILMCEGCLPRVAELVAGTSQHEAIRTLMAQRVVTTSKWLVMEGDWGGQVYLSVPMATVGATLADIDMLLTEIDHACWSCNEGEGSSWYMVDGQPGEGVMGGMGGGILLNQLWLHEELTGQYHCALPEFATPAEQATAATWLAKITAGLKLQ